MRRTMLQYVGLFTAISLLLVLVSCWAQSSSAQQSVTRLSIASAGSQPARLPHLGSTALLADRLDSVEADSIFDDEFDSPVLDAKWHWIREDSSHWSLVAHHGHMRIITQYGDLYEATNDAHNVLLQSISGPLYEITTKLAFSPELDYQQAGLLIYGDDDNYVRVTFGHIDGSRQFQLAKEVGGQVESVSQPAPGGNEFFLRLVRSGQRYDGYYSLDGSDWVHIGQYLDVSVVASQIGLAAFNSWATTDETPADFDFFHVVPGSAIYLPIVYHNSTGTTHGNADE